MPRPKGPLNSAPRRPRRKSKLIPKMSKSRSRLVLREFRNMSKEWTFTVVVQKGKRQKPKQQEIRYPPKLELLADVGRNLSTAGAGSELTNMVFTKRSEKQS